MKMENIFKNSDKYDLKKTSESTYYIGMIKSINCFSYIPSRKANVHKYIFLDVTNQLCFNTSSLKIHYAINQLKKWGSNLCLWSGYL